MDDTTDTLDAPPEHGDREEIRDIEHMSPEETHEYIRGLLAERNEFAVSGKLYREIVEGVSSVILRWKPDGTLTFVNQFEVDFLGYTREELLGQNITIFVPDRESTGRDLSTLIRDIAANPQKFYHNENENIRKDGSRVFMTWTNRPIFDEHDTLIEILSVGSDITRFHEAEQNLQRSEKRLDAFFVNSPVRMAILDEQLRYVQVNEITAQYFGRKPEDIPGLSIREAIPDFAPLIEPLLRQVLETDKPVLNQETSGSLPGRPNEIFHLISSYFPLTLPGDKPGLGIVALDITERKSAEERLRLIVENSPDIIFFQDRELRYSWIANPNVPTSEERILGKTDAEIPAFPDAAWIMDVKRSILETGKTRKIELRIFSKGIEHWFEDVYAPRRDERGNVIGLFGYARDITDRKHDEEALRIATEQAEAESAQLQTILENLNEGIIVSSVDGHLLQWNRAALEMHNFSNIEEARRWLPEFESMFEFSTLDGTVLSLDEWPLPHILRGEHLRDYELRIRRSDVDWQRVFSYGGSLVYDAGGQPLLAIITVQDITKRKQVEEALREREEDLNRAQAVAETGSWRLDIRNSELRWSAETYRIFGIPVGTPMTYERFLNAIHPEDREYVKQKWAMALHGESYDIEHRIIDGDTIKWVREKAEMEFDGAGNLKSGFGTVQDITSRKHAEAHTNELMERLKRQAIQLAATNRELEAFSYSVSHDLRAPLRSIDGFSLALIEDYAGKMEGEGEDYLQRIRAAVRRMSQLIEDILNLSRATRAEMSYTTVDLSAIAQSVIEELRRTDPDRTVDVVIQEGMTAQGDERLLRQVIENLLGNAWKFTSRTPDAHIEFGERRENGKTVFYVRDNGAGFDMRYADNLFMPFRRLHSEDEFPGTGIGLSLVRRIILRHGGNITAEAELGKGAIFSFTLQEE